MRAVLFVLIIVYVRLSFTAIIAIVTSAEFSRCRLAVPFFHHFLSVSRWTPSFTLTFFGYWCCPNGSIRYRCISLPTLYTLRTVTVTVTATVAVSCAPSLTHSITPSNPITLYILPSYATTFSTSTHPFVSLTHCSLSTPAFRNLPRCNTFFCIQLFLKSHVNSTCISCCIQHHFLPSHSG